MPGTSETNDVANIRGNRPVLVVALWGTVLLLVTLGGPVILEEAAMASGWKRCRDVSIEHPRVSTEGLSARGIGCERAGRIARSWMKHLDSRGKHYRPFGYKCRVIAGSGTVCRKHVLVARWRYSHGP